ncbi:bifunctional 4-hydroxy-2-oxoglutarate aldolase/2-dehydro-3-deoxy-phosphogluconate aldolase [Bifidobacterium sp. ESL0763]|uniref:bifunctional 4-hydroxy-2-oxoglutarate aldolase/2-dehydro-3-deoxy-phosphogluconate aldolase n=1 Tax=Bifidobacterium sp. ESL0763 TaxID=2983227 RepID=UPI0023F828F3|nr:bifunctional 4-hydroxy-2-oxoglutarate aldolase/2-dehydro-3-deoxy-phosphogluconate aldolase [Bifidobacterium sp. ESL0763]MDF7664266.1 bifunctional 4-hydroxy-2-oxoglutarate aldolase/2-dehydro-3-deoxy-phosphogluconate aldolase [Bifidobacterium sp. ESL0763]
MVQQKMADYSNDNKRLIEAVGKIGVVPLITLKSAGEAIPLVGALVDGKIPVAEVTFRSPYALEGMRRVHERFPDAILVAGTVRSVEQAKQSVEAGCSGIVTPFFDEEIVDWCLEHDVLILPGTATPYDVGKAFECGLRYVKFFPAQAYGGVNTLKALAGPFPEMHFLPTGGVDLGNAAQYIGQKNVFAIGGSFAVPSSCHEANDWPGITDTCLEARAIVDAVLRNK